MKQLKSNLYYRNKNTGKRQYLTYSDAILVTMKSLMQGVDYGAMLSLASKDNRRHLTDLWPTKDQYREEVDANGNKTYNYDIPIDEVYSFFHPYFVYLREKKFVEPICPGHVLSDKYGHEEYDIDNVTTFYVITAKGLKRAEKLWCLMNDRHPNDGGINVGWPLDRYLTKDDCNEALEFCERMYGCKKGKKRR